MAKRRSTVEFTDIIAPLLKELELSGFDIKSIVNGGVLLFSKLSGDEQKHAIAEANGVQLEYSPKKDLRDVFNIIKQLTETEKQQPGTVFRILGPDEQKTLDEFRKIIGPSSEERKKKAKRGYK